MERGSPWGFEPWLRPSNTNAPWRTGVLVHCRRRSPFSEGRGLAKRSISSHAGLR
jgi:hypothetical protein